jgi:hypothetical protein
MKIIITEQQRKFITEIIKLDIKVGDVIMGGKFKNKKVVVKTIGKNEKGDITINGKPLLRFRIIKESEHLKGLLSELPTSLKRRVTMEDLEWLDKSITGIIPGTPIRRDFDTFCYDVLGDLLHEFVVERKDDEIDTVDSPEYGLVYSEDGFNEVASIYWKLMPFLKKRYEIKLSQAFDRKYLR